MTARSRKMSRPERAQYFRVFALELLMDEAYEGLDRAEWGSVFLLMLHQWAKGGSLPDEDAKLAHLARCTQEELGLLFGRWPKIQPIEGQPGRCGIPYLVREFSQVMDFYEAQRARSVLGVAARMGQGPMDDPLVTHGLTAGQPSLDKDKDKDKDKEEEKGKAEPKIIDQVVEIWNAMAMAQGLPQVLKVEGKRRDAIRARLKDRGWFDLFQEAIQAVATSPELAWARGQKPMGDGGFFKADLEYLLKPGKALWLVEKARAAGQGRGSPPASGAKRPRFLQDAAEEMKAQLRDQKQTKPGPEGDTLDPTTLRTEQHSPGSGDPDGLCGMQCDPAPSFPGAQAVV